jgi:tetratricopeptide (TPR) repeat protein
MLSLGARPKALRGAAISLFCAVLCAAPPARADELQDASRLLKAGQPEEALKKVNQVLAEKGDNLQARFLKGLILAEQGNTREAIEIFTKLTRDYPDLPEPYNNLAVIYASVGQYNEARAALEQSIRTRPSYATAYENLGDVYAKLASQAYDKVVQLDSSNSGARNKLSLARELVSRPAMVAPSGRLPEPQPIAATESSPPPVVAEPDVSRPPTAAEAAISPSPPATKLEAKDVSAEVLETVNGWAEAWSRQDADAYLAYYAKDFKTPGGEPRAEWAKMRRSLVRAPKSIAVGIESPRVTMVGARRASISFVQTYRSDKLNSTVRKTLLMTRAEGRWQISEEKTPP